MLAHEALRDPRPPDHRDLRAWIGGDFDPEASDLEVVIDELMHRNRRRRRSPQRPVRQPDTSRLLAGGCAHSPDRG